MNNLTEATTIFFHGIGGSGMRGLAWLLFKQGKTIVGTDSIIPKDLPTEYTLVPEDRAAELLGTADVYIHSDAVSHEHPLYIQAPKRLAYQEALGAFSQAFTTIAIAGTHGKSSTTAFLGHILIEAGLDPTILVGAAMPSLPGKHARMGKGNLFVVEADEYRDHFLELAPAHAIVTTMEFDHPDYFATFADVQKSFQKFITNTTGSVYIAPQVQDSATFEIPSNVTVVPAPTDIVPPIPGDHMAQNAALAIALATELGVAKQDATSYLATFPGLARRFETVGQIGQAVIISDYAHHPSEITATIEAARMRYPNKKIGIIFEAHTGERLAAFWKDFSKALSAADGVLLHPPFLPKGRSEQEGESAFAKLSQELPTATIMPKNSDLSQYLPAFCDTMDVVIACSAGALDGNVRKIVK